MHHVFENTCVSVALTKIGLVLFCQKDARQKYVAIYNRRLNFWKLTYYLNLSSCYLFFSVCDTNVRQNVWLFSNFSFIINNRCVSYRKIETQKLDTRKVGEQILQFRNAQKSGYE